MDEDGKTRTDSTAPPAPTPTPNEQQHSRCFRHKRSSTFQTPNSTEKNSDSHILAVNERERPVLESTAAVSLRVDVGHLLQLKRALHGHRLPVALAEDEAVALVQQPGNKKQRQIITTDGQEQNMLLIVLSCLMRIWQGERAVPMID